MTEAEKRKIFKNYINPVFIETGTWKGDGVYAALEYGFGRVISIEVNEGLFNGVSKRFKDNKKVELYHGDSTDLLPSILTTVHDPITFWLDAHIQAKMGQGKKPNPVIEEITSIINHMLDTGLKHTILVDDVRFFRRKRFGISLTDILNTLNPIINDYDINFVDGHTTKDILIVTPC